MRIADADILILPGLGNSGEGHWQLRWAEKMSTAAIVEQAEWDEPDPEDWTDTIVKAVELAERPVRAGRCGPSRHCPSTGWPCRSSPNRC